LTYRSLQISFWKEIVEPATHEFDIRLVGIGVAEVEPGLSLKLGIRGLLN
jgi:hypothetical protein